MKIIVAALATALLASCSGNPSVTRVNAQAMAGTEINTILVPRFEGNPNFVEESTDLFIAELETRVSARVVQGSALRPESPDVLAGGNLAPTELAVEKARETGAQVVILGKVTSHQNAGTLNGFSTVRVIRVSDGAVLANFHRPSGLLVGHSQHHAVMAAVKRTAADVAKTLK